MGSIKWSSFAFGVIATVLVMWFLKNRQRAAA